jgi:hypothetical protein
MGFITSAGRYIINLICFLEDRRRSVGQSEAIFEAYLRSDLMCKRIRVFFKSSPTQMANHVRQLEAIYFFLLICVLAGEGGMSKFRGSYLALR